MLKLMLALMKAMFTVLSWPWRIWLMGLMFVNMIAPLFFLGHREAQAVLLATMIAAGIQMAIFKSKGFVRLLGISHIITWVPVLIWLWSRLPAIGTDSLFGKWVLAVIVIDVISLVIDAVDVGRYVSGDRTPAATLESA